MEGVEMEQVVGVQTHIKIYIYISSKVFEMGKGRRM